MSPCEYEKERGDAAWMPDLNNDDFFSVSFLPDIAG
jgi:hypothetical protein